MHDGRIVALGTPAALLAGVGDEVVELRVTPDGDAAAVLAALRARRHRRATTRSSSARTITIPIRDRRARRRRRASPHSTCRRSRRRTRPPHLDDVYLRLTGDRIAA